MAEQAREPVALRLGGYAATATAAWVGAAALLTITLRRLNRLYRVPGPNVPVDERAVAP
jgi:hypothetical protein